jgi:hypothetical protein
MLVKNNNNKYCFNANDTAINKRYSNIHAKMFSPEGITQMEKEEIHFLKCCINNGFCSKCFSFPEENGIKNPCYDILGKYFKLNNK